MRRVLIFTFLMAVLSVSAMAASIRFEQDGWSPGGPLRVAFSGQDTNGDGTLLVGELTDFAALWTTPGGVDTTWRLPDVEPDGFVFTDLDNYVFFVRNPQYSLVSSAFEGEALASVFDEFLFPVSSTVSPAAAVPEPETLSLLAMGTLALLWGHRRAPVSAVVRERPPDPRLRS